MIPLAESICSDNETGFRPGRGVADAAFLMRRIMDEWNNSCCDPGAVSDPDMSDSLHVLFIEMRRAFDAVPRSLLWRILHTKAKVPFHIVHLLDQLHCTMTTRVCHNGRLGPKVAMRTGVRQGSVEGPTLYLIYFSFVLKHWRSRCLASVGHFGVDWQGCTDGTLRVPSKIRKADCRFVSISDAEFADDTVYLDSNWDRFQTCCAILDDTLQLFGAQMNKAKTERLELEGFATFKDAAPLPGRKVLWVNGVAIPKTAVFRYLGSMLSIDDSLGVKMDICRRVSLAHAAFGQLRHVWRSRQLSLRLKRELLMSCVASVLLYGSELWTLDATDLRYLQRTWRSFLRNALCLSCNDIAENHISDLELHRRLGAPSILTLLHQRLTRWLGHLARLPVDRITRLLLFGTIQHRHSPPSVVTGRRHSYLSRVIGLLQSLSEVDTRIWAQQAVDKVFLEKGGISH